MQSILLLIITISLISNVHSLGQLILIGGGRQPFSVMDRIANLAKCKPPYSKHLIIIPTASEDPDTPEHYRKLVQSLYKILILV